MMTPTMNLTILTYQEMKIMMKYMIPFPMLYSINIGILMIKYLQH